MTNPAISIITPVWNGLAYLKECVESVLMQDFQDWEMLISDDGSTDGSRDYLKTLNDPRIKVHFQTVNLGIFGNLNSIFKRAKAPISQILCQDDYFLSSDSLATIVKYWETAPANIGFVVFNNDGLRKRSLLGFQVNYLPNVIDPTQADQLFFVFWNMPGNLTNISLRTNMVEELGGFNQAYPYAGDFEFWTRAAEVHAFGVLRDVVTYVRGHAGAASNFLNFKGELLSQNAFVVNRLYEKLLLRFPSLKRAMKLHATLCFDAIQKDAGLKKLILKGDGGYLKELNKVSTTTPCIIKNSFVRWVLFLFSCGGRIGRLSTGKYLIRHFSN